MTHMFGVIEGCSSNDAEVRAARAEWMALRAAGDEFTHPLFDTGSVPHDPRRGR